MNDCEPKILVEAAHYSIAQCVKCNRIGLYYNNLLIGFELTSFCRFAKAVLKLDFNRSSILFPDQKRHILLNTCHHDIQLSFVKEEFEEFSTMLNQALLMIEADIYTRTKVK